MTKTQLAQEIFSRYGAVVRCRGHFVYTKKGVRLVDLFREDGRAVLGWRGAAFTRLKDVLGKGVTGSFLGEQGTGHQLNKALEKLASLNEASTVSVEGCFVNFDCTSLDFPNLKSLTPPFPWASDIFIAWYDQKNTLSHDEEAFLSAYKTTVPSPLAAAIIRSIYDFTDFLQTISEKELFIYDKALTPYFKRSGMILQPKIQDSALYDQFVLFCLDNGVIINPELNGTSLVPFGCDKGVFSKLSTANGEKFL